MKRMFVNVLTNASAKLLSAQNKTQLWMLEFRNGKLVGAYADGRSRKLVNSSWIDSDLRLSATSTLNLSPLLSTSILTIHVLYTRQKLLCGACRFWGSQKPSKPATWIQTNSWQPLYHIFQGQWEKSIHNEVVFELFGSLRGHYDPPTLPTLKKHVCDGSLSRSGRPNNNR